MTSAIRQATLVLLTGVMLWTNLLSGSGGGFADDPSAPAVFFLYPTGFTPAAFTFAVWAPIFLGTVALAIYQALPAQRDNRTLDRMARPYTLALIANAATPFLGLGPSNLAVLILFLTLATAFALVQPVARDRGFRMCVQAPLAIFATWSGLATILNACQWVVAMGGSVGPVPAAILVTGAMAAGVAAILRTREPLIATVMVWAGIGIAWGQSGMPLLVAVVAVTSLGTIWAARRVS